MTPSTSRSIRDEPPTGQASQTPGAVESRGGRSRVGIFAGIAVILLLIAGGVVWSFQEGLLDLPGDGAVESDPGAPPTDRADTGPPREGEGRGLVPPPSGAPVAEGPEVSSRVEAGDDGLARRVDALEARLDSLASASASSSGDGSDDEGLREQVSRLAELSGRLEPLPGAVETLRGRVDALEQAVEAIRAGAGSSGESADAALVGPPLARAISLFDQGQYDRALEVLNDLREIAPEDARVWYYSALANGFASGDWQGGETERLFLEGAEREQAGTPPARAIEASLAGLTRARGRAWVDYYRARAAE